MTREQLRAVLDSVTVVDAQPPARYGQRHLPGALNLVAEDSEEHVTGALPDAAAPVVVYSTDADCCRAPELAARLQALGYADVRIYGGGIEDWVAAGLAIERPRGVTLELSDLALGPTAFLFEGFPRAGVDVSIFVTPPRPGARSSFTSIPTRRPSCSSRGADAGRAARRRSSWSPRECSSCRPTRRMASAMSATCRCSWCPSTNAAPCARRGWA
jgi:rhodanese-related sulfurtransferase